MAIQRSLRFQATPPAFLAPTKTTPPSSTVHFKRPPVGFHSPLLHKSKTLTNGRRNHYITTKAIEESKESIAGGETQSDTELSELGIEIKKAMDRTKEDKSEGDLWSGVAEEIREIEWPVIGKVLSTTGVVLGVIAGSSVVLLTVNAVLSQLSDSAFAGNGVQDFF